MTATQRNLLIFLCTIVFLTVVAVLLANLGIPYENETTQTFAKWGLSAVLVEIVGLFVFVARGIFGHKIKSYSLVITAPGDLPGLDIARVSWDGKKCFLLFKEERYPIQPTLSQVGPALEIRLPGVVYEKVDENDSLELILTDASGNQWEVRPFYLFQRPLTLSTLSDRQTIMAAYGYRDE